MFGRKVTTWYRRFSRQQLIYFGSVLLLIFGTGLWAWRALYNEEPISESAMVSLPLIESADAVDAVNVSPLPVKRAPSPASSSHSFLFGVGTELDHAINHRITKEAPIKMLTSWFNGTNDLGFMKGWQNTLIPKAYSSGYALHLIIYNNDTEQNLNTPYGPACGRPYPLSAQFISDIEQLAQIFSGGKLYVSMFTEFQTYPCEDNTWAAGENYYKTLQDQYLAALKIFHQHAPGSQVSLTWGGWQAKWDDAGQGGGLSLFKHFADVMNASDFQSFQAMANTSNLDIITEMTKVLSPYKGGVMVAHYKPDNGSQKTFDSDMKSIFTPSKIADLQKNGLFAFSFMDTTNMNSSESAYQTVKDIVTSYTK